MGYEVKLVKIGEIMPYERNAKKHPERQIKEIANSIREFGFQQPIVIDENNQIIIGHGRFEAAKLLELEEVPCIIAGNLTEEQVKALRLVDNKTNESPWDLEILSAELDSIFNIDMQEFGFMDVNLESFFEAEDEGASGNDDSKSEEAKIYVITIICKDEQRHDEIVKVLQENEISYEEERK